MKKTLSKAQKTVLFLAGIAVAFSILYLSQAYFSYQQVKALTDQCYGQDGFPKVVKSGFEVEVFECNFYDGD